MARLLATPLQLAMPKTCLKYRNSKWYGQVVCFLLDGPEALKDCGENGSGKSFDDDEDEWGEFERLPRWLFNLSKKTLINWPTSFSPSLSSLIAVLWRSHIDREE